MRILIATFAILFTTVFTRTQTTVPADVAAIETCARQAFNRGEYAAALPLFEKVAEAYQSQPERLGPIQERIKVCKKAIETATAEPVQGLPADPEMSPDKRKPHPVPKIGAEPTLTIKELGNFEYDAERGGNIPDDVKALSGAKLKVTGFMIPMDQAEQISQFALVPSLFACCFGQPPQIQHTIVVNCPKGKAVNYFPDEINVEGTLRVDEKKEDGFIVSIFEIECLSVKPVAR